MGEVSTVKCKSRYIQIYLPFSIQEYRTDISCRCTDGSPTNCLLSARSTNAKSIAAVMFEVVSIITLGYLKNKYNYYDNMSVVTTVLYLFYVMLNMHLDIFV
jgi:hypothetical protein